MKSMIERVARALADGMGYNFDECHSGKSEWIATRGEKGGLFRDVNDPFQADFLDVAQAAIEAMREPSSGTNDLVVNLRAIDEEAMYQKPASTKEIVDRAADLIEHLVARLEIPAPPFEAYDGIACRDETIKLLDKKVAAEKARADRMAVAAVTAVMPLEAIRMAGTDKQHCADIQDAIREGIEAVRSAIRAHLKEMEG